MTAGGEEGTEDVVGDSFRVSSDGNLVALVWTKQPSLDGVRALDGVMRSVSARQSARIGFVTLIEPDAIRSSPEASVRQATAAVLKTFNARIGAAVVIHEPRGVKATILRSVIMVINVLAGTAFPNQVQSNVGDAARWLASSLGRDAPPNAERRIVDLITRHRSRVG